MLIKDFLNWLSEHEETKQRNFEYKKKHRDDHKLSFYDYVVKTMEEKSCTFVDYGKAHIEYPVNSGNYFYINKTDLNISKKFWELNISFEKFAEQFIYQYRYYFNDPYNRFYIEIFSENGKKIGYIDEYGYKNFIENKYVELIDMFDNREREYFKKYVDTDLNLKSIIVYHSVN